MSEISSFKKILAYTPQPSILLQVIDRELLIVGANNAYLQLLGAKEENIVQKHLFNTPNWGLSGINSEVVVELKSNLDKAILTKATIQLTEQSVSIFYVSQNKVTQFFISFTITPIAEESTNKIGIILLSLDNDTEKVALKQDKAQYQSMLNDCKNDLEEIENRLLIGRWEIDIVSKKIWWSDEIYNICGYEPQSFDPSERQQFSVTHPDDIESARITLEQTIRYGTPFSIERRLIKANGEIVYVLSKGKAVLNDAGETIKVKGFFQDITQQVLQKDTINSVRINQEALINGTNDLVWLMDKQMQVLVANDAYYNKMQELADGYTKNHNEEVVNTKNERQKRWTNLIPEVLKGNSLTFKENILNPLSNSYEYALVTLNPIKNDKGEVINIACFAKDITVETYNLQTLETTKTRLENILTASPDIICSLDGNAIFLDVSAASEKVLGYKPEEMIGKSIAAFLPSEDLLKTLAEAPKVRATGVLIHFENKYIKKDGSIVNMSWTGSYQAEKDILYCVGRDITEKKRIELSLIASERYYKSLFESNPSPMFIWDFETLKIVECNVEAIQLYGYTKEEFLQLTIKDIRPVEDIELIEAATQSTEIYGNIHKQQWRHKKKDGTIFYVDIHAHVMLHHDRQCSFVLIQDVTIKKQIEDALKASEKDYKNLFESNPSPMLIWDFETLKIKEANLQSRELFGYSSQEFLQLSVLDLIFEEDYEKAKNAFKIQLTNGEFAVQGTKLKKKNGEILLADITANNFNYKGRISSVVLFNDVTEKIKTQKIIAESEAKYRSFFENSIDGIFITRKSGGILDVNPSGCKMLQMTKEEICRVGRNGTVDTSDPRLTTFLETRQKLGYAKGIVTHIRKDGSRFEAEVSSSTFINANGEEENALIVRDITERIKNQEQIKESNERFNYVSKATSDAIWDWDLNTNHIFWGEGFQNIFGYSKDDIVPSSEFREQRIHPRDKERVMEGMFVVIKSKNNIWEDSYRFMKADGSYAQVLNRGFVIRDEQGRAIRMVGAKRDISQYQYYSDLEKLERNILAINEAGDKSLEEVLSIYLLGIEVLHPSMICSILQLKGQQLFNLVAPSLPEAYCNAINGGFIGENAGSCGTAAFTKKNVIVTDIENDPRWANYKSIALEYNLRACWSHPIFNQKGEVIATFAAYYQHPKTPSVLEENTIARANNILKIILESYARTKALKESNERYNLATKATSDAIWDWDLETGSMIWTEGWQSIFGYNLQNIPNDISFKLQNTHPDDVEKIRASYYKIVKSKDINWVEQYKFKKANGEFAYVISKGFVVRDEEGRAKRMVGATRDITKRKQEELRLKLLESVITNTNDAVLITDSEPLDMPGPRIVYVNEAFTTMTGYTAEEVIGDTPRILQGPKSNRNELDRLKEALKRWESCEATLLNFRKDGSEFWVNINISPVADETGWYTHWVAIQRDITEKVLEEQNLTKAIIKAQENERYEIGGELHDNVCQILTSSQLSLKMLKKVLGPKELIWYEKGTEAITLASREIRNLSHRLAPSFFNDTTLELAITTLVQTFNIEEKYQIHILFDDKFKAQPTKQEFQINLYRIVQEQLKNIFKYAEASVIEIVGTVKNGKLKMEIIDNGLGFDTTQNYTGIGMANMKRRTELFLGKFEVISTVGKGCKIIIEVPIEEVN
jgi:PAS domain S-box-containing protein